MKNVFISVYYGLSLHNTHIIKKQECDVMYYTDEELPTVATFEEAREYLFVGRNTLLDLLHSGKLMGKKIGNKWRIKKENLIAFASEGYKYDE